VIDRLAFSDFTKYTDAVSVLQAREVLVALDVSSYPHMKTKECRNKMRERYKREARFWIERNESGSMSILDQIERKLTNG
jgi:hypothetical protein